MKKITIEWAQLFGAPEYSKLGYNQGKSTLELINPTQTRKYKNILEAIC